MRNPKKCPAAPIPAAAFAETLPATHPMANFDVEGVLAVAVNPAEKVEIVVVRASLV